LRAAASERLLDRFVPCLRSLNVLIEVFLWILADAALIDQ
jgi:hypothetical protein